MTGDLLQKFLYTYL